MPEDMKRAEAEFDDWWRSGLQALLRVMTLPEGEKREEGMRLLCRVAYFQGRIDEANKTTRQLVERAQHVVDRYGG